jgi:hypothetical protein
MASQGRRSRTPARALVDLDLLLTDLSVPSRSAVTESVPRHTRSVETSRLLTTASSSHGTTVYPTRTAPTVRAHSALMPAAEARAPARAWSPTASHSHANSSKGVDPRPPAGRPLSSALLAGGQRRSQSASAMAICRGRAGRRHGSSKTLAKPRSTEAHMRDGAFTLVRSPFSSLGPCTH